MTAPIAPIAQKLSAIIRRLSSDHDGEIIACVAAIKRLLQGVGLDFHDLAIAVEHGVEARLQEPPPATRPAAKSAPAPSWREAPSAPFWLDRDAKERDLWLASMVAYPCLSEWGHGFVESIVARRTREYDPALSDKQIDVLDRIIVKLWRRGACP